MYCHVNHLFRILAIFLMSGSMAMSADKTDVILRITGTINSPTCVINGGKTIEVNFGSIPVSEMSDPKYAKTTKVSVSCPYYSGVPYVKIKANSLGTAGNVVATTTKNFGLALYQSNRMDKPLLIGDGLISGGNSYGYRISWGLDYGGVANDAFTFTAVPYRLGSEELSAGPFSASATISLSYV